LLASIGAQQEHKVINIERDYAELKVPAFVQNGPVSPYAPGMDISSKRVEGTVLVADLRGFSSWESSSSPEAVQALFETISERIVQMQIDNYFDYWKLMGDGIMLVWESKENVDTALLSVSAAFDLRKHYWYVKKRTSRGCTQWLWDRYCGWSFNEISLQNILRERGDSRLPWAINHMGGSHSIPCQTRRSISQ